MLHITKTLLELKILCNNKLLKGRKERVVIMFNKSVEFFKNRVIPIIDMLVYISTGLMFVYSLIMFVFLVFQNSTYDNAMRAYFGIACMCFSINMLVYMYNKKRVQGLFKRIIHRK
jgi:hypothetical protein